MRWLDDITNSMDINLSKVWEMVKDRGFWYAEVQRAQRWGSWARQTGVYSSPASGSKLGLNEPLPETE